MTKQDVDNIISVLCPNDGDFDELLIISPEYLKKELEALALEQQPCEDCISRQAVLNTLFYKSDNNCEVVLNKELQDRIKALPHVTPTHKEWIPVSERMPNFNDIVLANTDSNYDESKVIIIVYNADEFWFNGRIKAWMPLPKPYRAESEDKE